jgi:FHS family glucose/mannose:H+ symporter-like MFS transporter
MNIPPLKIEAQPSVARALNDFRNFGSVAFALLLFFQFGNEWAIAGWLPIFLIEQLGISPKTSILMLALYWTALLVGRVAVFAILRHVPHSRLLFGSASGAAFGCILLFFIKNLFGATVAILLTGFSFAAIYPLVAEKIGRRFNYYHPTLFNGIFSFAMVGGLLAPGTLGLFADSYGIKVVAGLPLVGTCTVVLLVLLIWLEAKVTGR